MSLERQCLSSLLCDRSLDIRAAQKLILVWEAIGIECTNRRGACALPTKQHIFDNSVPISPVSFRLQILSQNHLPVLRTALGVYHLLSTVLKHRALNQRLRTHARINACRLLVVVVVEDVRCAKTEQGAATGDAVEVVVGVGNAEVAGVFGSVLVRVADEGALRLCNR